MESNLTLNKELSVIDYIMAEVWDDIKASPNPTLFPLTCNGQAGVMGAAYTGDGARMRGGRRMNE